MIPTDVRIAHMIYLKNYPQILNAIVYRQVMGLEILRAIHSDIVNWRKEVMNILSILLLKCKVS